MQKPSKIEIALTWSQTIPVFQITALSVTGIYVQFSLPWFQTEGTHNTQDREALRLNFLKKKNLFTVAKYNKELISDKQTFSNRLFPD